MAEHLVFEAGEQTFGVKVDSVREVVRAVTLSRPVAQEDAIEGLLNLRGQVVSVIDLEQFLNLQTPPLSQSDYLVVLSDRNDRLCAVRACGQVRLTTDAELVVDSPAAQDDDINETNSQPARQAIGQADAARPPEAVTAGYLRVGHLVVPLLDPEALSRIAQSSVEAASVSAMTTDSDDAEADA